MEPVDGFGHVHDSGALPARAPEVEHRRGQGHQDAGEDHGDDGQNKREPWASTGRRWRRRPGRRDAGRVQRGRRQRRQRLSGGQRGGRVARMRSSSTARRQLKSAPMTATSRETSTRMGSGPLYSALPSTDGPGSGAPTAKCSRFSTRTNRAIALAARASHRRSIGRRSAAVGSSRGAPHLPSSSRTRPVRRTHSRRPTTVSAPVSSTTVSMVKFQGPPWPLRRSASP